jgi:hypothetical protein
MTVFDANGLAQEPNPGLADTSDWSRISKAACGRGPIGRMGIAFWEANECSATLVGISRHGNS